MVLVPVAGQGTVGFRHETFVFPSVGITLHRVAVVEHNAFRYYLLVYERLGSRKGVGYQHLL